MNTFGGDVDAEPTEEMAEYWKETQDAIFSTEGPDLGQSIPEQKAPRLPAPKDPSQSSTPDESCLCIPSLAHVSREQPRVSKPDLFSQLLCGALLYETLDGSLPSS